MFTEFQLTPFFCQIAQLYLIFTIVLSSMNFQLLLRITLYMQFKTCVKHDVIYHIYICIYI